MSLGVSGVEGVGVNGGTSVTGLKPGSNYSIDILINKCAGVIYAYRGFSLPTDGKIEFHRF